MSEATDGLPQVDTPIRLPIDAYQAEKIDHTVGQLDAAHRVGSNFASLVHFLNREGAAPTLSDGLGEKLVQHRGPNGPANELRTVQGDIEVAFEDLHRQLTPKQRAKWRQERRVARVAEARDILTRDALPEEVVRMIADSGPFRSESFREQLRAALAEATSSE